MERPVRGDVVVVPFPFSDLSAAKRRPALVVSSPGGDLILCQITSQSVRDGYAVPLGEPDFATGALKHESNIRPNRLFTAAEQIVLYRVGQLKREKMLAVTDAIIRILKE
ncbi:MAG: type II toxin-antitoxin system PemK/MazF family toxin [Planctomycetes bacterium]|nr:type II toxin-antitoxin system PemK/MazF family toxin [Planctomycetota bacterium]